MEINMIVEAAMKEIKQHLETFCSDAGGATMTPETAQAFCGALSSALAQGGVAALRTYLLQHEAPADVVSAGGESFRFKQVREKKFLTPFGPMTLARRCYQNASDTRSHVPLDAAWGMRGQYVAPQVREALLFACAHMTPEETARLMNKCSPAAPHATVIKRVVNEAGAVIAEHRQTLDRAIRQTEHAPEDAGALVVSADGATVLMNERGATFGRRAQRPGGKKPDTGPTAYRVAMTGSVSHYAKPSAPGESPERLQSRYVAHMPQPNNPVFKALLEQEIEHAEQHAPPGLPRILLLDGARDLWNYFDKHPRYDAYHRCIDFWHAVQHLSTAAHALFHDPREADRWYHRYRKTLLEHHDGARRVLRSIDYHTPKRKRGPTRAKHLQEERTYFARNHHRMPYKRFRDHGWPIGSGPIEAACKTLIKTRLCRSGMRWTPNGGQNILALRTYAKSQRWEQAWENIQQLQQAA